MEYKKIHVCPNDYILFKKDFELLKNCSRCGLSRYKLKQKYWYNPNSQEDDQGHNRHFTL